MTWIKGNLTVLLVCMAMGFAAGDTFGSDSLDTGYLYEKPNKSLLIPTAKTTEIPVSVSEKDEEYGNPTESANGNQPPEAFTSKPESKTPDGYLPPEDEQFLVRDGTESVGKPSQDGGSKNQKRNIQFIRGKFAGVKEEEKVRPRPIHGLSPKQTIFNKPGTLKETKQIFRL